jgi:FkbM family methyltransferase
MIELFRILKFIYKHPFNSQNKSTALINFFKWQLNCFLNPYPIIYNFTENFKLIIAKGLNGATGNLYCGLMEYNEMAFLLHFLRPNDLFIDVGANIGAYTILASSEIKAKTISIEPLESTYLKLLENISINKINKNVKALNIGLGSKIEELYFTKSLDTINHVTFKKDINTAIVKIDTLDYLLKNNDCPSLIKIDVEGFEAEVINGAKKTLSNKLLKAIIIELNGSGLRYGFNDNDIHSILIKHGFKPYGYNSKSRNLKEQETFGTHNTIYVRDVDFVQEKLKSARKIKVGSNKTLI